MKVWQHEFSPQLGHSCSTFTYFFCRITEMYDTKYIMKVDDDSYVNTDKLISYLQFLSNQSLEDQPTWIGK